MKKRKKIVLYNVLFPFWALFLLPWLPTWPILLAGNFLIDSVVLLFAMTYWGYPNRVKTWKSSILKIWVIGFVSDILGALLTFGLTYVLLALGGYYGDMLCFPVCQLLALPGIVLAAILISILNRLSFRRTPLEAGQIHKLCFALAVFTAPYTMLLPTEWFQ